MAKEKRKQDVAPVAKAAETPAEAVGNPDPTAGVHWVEPIYPAPMPTEQTDPLLTLYAAVLASVDWQRDVRRHDTVCRHAYAIAKTALEVFIEKRTNEE